MAPKDILVIIWALSNICVGLKPLASLGTATVFLFKLYQYPSLAPSRGDEKLQHQLVALQLTCRPRYARHRRSRRPRSSLIYTSAPTPPANTTITAWLNYSLSHTAFCSKRHFVKFKSYLNEPTIILFQRHVRPTNMCIAFWSLLLPPECKCRPLTKLLLM